MPCPAFPHLWRAVAGPWNDDSCEPRAAVDCLHAVAVAAHEGERGDLGLGPGGSNDDAGDLHQLGDVGGLEEGK